MTNLNPVLVPAAADLAASAMIHMDIDTHSPPSCCQRYTSAKRARSPELSSPHDRPSKRLSLVTGHPNPYASLNIRRCLGDSSTGSSRHSSEDWVQQAGGLTIDSPIYAGSSLPEQMEDAERVQKDEDMMMLSTGHNPQERSVRVERPQLPLLQTSGYPIFTSEQSLNPDTSHGLHEPPLPCTGANPLENAPFQVASPLRHDQPYQRKALPGANPIVGPSINVVPPTPMEQPAAQEYTHTRVAFALSSSVSPQATPMLSSPKLPTPKKQRFMMGPRADCEKCRLGVKGHFVHLE